LNRFVKSWSRITLRQLATYGHPLHVNILCDPCPRWFNQKKLMVLHTDFSAKGFGYAVCQADEDDVSLALASQFMSGNGFHFLTKTNGGVLYPVAFGSWRTQGNEKHHHSYLSEGFCGTGL
jgi:hypothetical protein